MKIGVIGDNHIGGCYSLGKTDPATQLNSRLLDFANTFNTIVDTFIAKGVKVVVLTGDCFENRKPNSEQLNTFSKCIKRIVKAGLKLFIVVGNHDQQRSIKTTTLDIFNHLEIPEIQVFPDLALRTLNDAGKPINLVFMPYRDRRMLNTTTNSEAIAVIKSELDALTANLSGPKVLVGHFMFEKTDETQNPDSFSINELILPLDLFKDFDAVLMGHVHKHSVLSDKKPVIIYTGSMEKVSFGEKEHNKVSVIIDTDDPEHFEIIPTQTRNIYELNFDYSAGERLYKEAITDKIIEDINAFDTKTPLKDAVVKLVARVKDADLYFINHQKIRDHLWARGINNLISANVSSVVFRQLRNSAITEDIDEKKAMSAFIKNLPEQDVLKKRLQKYAEQIIDDAGSK